MREHDQPLLFSGGGGELRLVRLLRLLRVGASLECGGVTREEDAGEQEGRSHDRPEPDRMAGPMVGDASQDRPQMAMRMAVPRAMARGMFRPGSLISSANDEVFTQPS